MGAARLADLRNKLLPKLPYASYNGKAIFILFVKAPTIYKKRQICTMLRKE